MLTSETGVHLEEKVQEKVEGIIDKHGSEIGALPQSHFRRIFWNQQVTRLLCLLLPSINMFVPFADDCIEAKRMDRSTLAPTICEVVPQPFLCFSKSL